VPLHPTRLSRDGLAFCRQPCAFIMMFWLPLVTIALCHTVFSDTEEILLFDIKSHGR
jgi:hypothetical protein